jgi:hypothetical protein
MKTTKHHSGELSFEGILWLAFFCLIAATVIAIIQFYNVRNPASGKGFDITQSYNLILTNMREDSQIAAVAEPASDSVTLLDCNSDLVSRYALTGGQLQRFDNQGTSLVLLEKVESASFTTDENLKNLLTVKILPSDPMDIPFFTSFALRGINNDLN